MTQSEFNHLLHFAKVNDLPRPRRRPITGKNGQYVAQLSTNRIRGSFVSYTAAMAVYVGLIDEKKQSGWGL